MKVAIAAALMLLGRLAFAERGELHLQFAPTISVISADDSYYVGPGGLFMTSYGLRDWVSISGEMICERFPRVLDSQFEDGHLSYTSTRCGLGPTLSAHIGVRNITSLSFGAAYRFDVQAGRELGNSSGVFVKDMDTAIKNALLVTATVGIERRFSGPFTAGVYTRVGRPLVGGMSSELDFTVAAILGMFLFL